MVMTVASRVLMPIAAAFCAALAVSPLYAQAVLSDFEKQIAQSDPVAAAQWRLAFRPPFAVIQQSATSLSKQPNLDPKKREEAEALLAQTAKSQGAEAQKYIWNALALLLNRPWTENEQFLSALALRSSSPIMTGTGDKISFQTLFTAPVPKQINYSIDLVESLPTTSATPIRGGIIKKLTTGNLTNNGFPPVEVDLSDVSDGTYLIIAHVSIDQDSPRDLAFPIYLIRDLDQRYDLVKAQLATIKDHAPAKAVIEYPFALAKAIQAGTREIISYDFTGSIKHAFQVLIDLKSNSDPVWQAKGLQSRAYRFPETGELVPYQLYVPAKWTPGQKWPLVVALHGANLDENNMLGRAGGKMRALADQYGFIVVAPLGYRLNSSYGSQRGVVASMAKSDDPRFRRSEQDVLEVLHLVETEFRTDTARRYLTGNSMGGAGTWWLGLRHPELWAAIAPAAYGSVISDDVAALKTIPIMMVVGDKDELGFLDRVREAAEVLRAGGAKFQYVEVPGGTHASGFDIAMPDIFQFFAQHHRGDGKPAKGQ
jgi:poly(3-hydroxybutyrate) depolymerase